MAMRNQVEWALHCCSVLIGLAPGEYVATKKLAEFHGVPKEYLSKALQALAAAGLIEGTLGPTGGYRLAKAPKDISFLHIVEAVEGRSHSFQCTEIRGNNPCLGKKAKQPTEVCAVAKVMYRADEAWRSELRAVNLEDLRLAVQKSVAPDLLEEGARFLSSR